MVRSSPACQVYTVDEACPYCTQLVQTCRSNRFFVAPHAYGCAWLYVNGVLTCMAESRESQPCADTIHRSPLRCSRSLYVLEGCIHAVWLHGPIAAQCSGACISGGGTSGACALRSASVKNQSPNSRQNFSFCGAVKTAATKRLGFYTRLSATSTRAAPATAPAAAAAAAAGRTA